MGKVAAPQPRLAATATHRRIDLRKGGLRPYARLSSPSARNGRTRRSRSGIYKRPPAESYLLRPTSHQQQKDVDR
ncbi:hypothetical protein CGCA056_v004990 [Colletotrichum aenigma]|uniref:uncharacterized protein n=1 Tax=Colletotrichum aenigma TaxID=1215731 RepID=UPI001872489C|nr:uncharacterized protein CGCA056_v004990 [Colletotrichum aenigma]KAF5523461.1 hypothetical protein CGCA056_v004990 [Colletotrichum aenigma]